MTERTTKGTTKDTMKGTEGAQAPASADPRRWWGLGVLALGLSMIVLDGTIVGVALPRIIEDLQLTLTDAQWSTSSPRGRGRRATLPARSTCRRRP